MLKKLLIGWIKNSEIRTQSFLGKRDYIGMSDVGKMFGCTRQAVASKAFPSAIYPTVDEIQKMNDDELKGVIERIRPLERGHEQETGIVSAINGLGLPHIEQLEIRVDHMGIPVVAHLDHVLFDSHIKVLESKANEITPGVLYPEYEGQLYGQIGLLKRYFYDNVFSIRDETGSLLLENATFIQIAEFLGVPRPEAAISGFVMSMNGKAVRPFGPYYATEIMTELVLKKAAMLHDLTNAVLQGTVNLDDLEYAKGFYPLCDYCQHSLDCPKFTSQSALMDRNDAIIQLKAVQAEEKRLSKLVKALKDDLAKSYEGLGLDGSEYVQTGDFRFRNGVQYRASLQKDLLREKLSADHGIAEDEITDLFEQCSKKSEFRRLDVYKATASKTASKMIKLKSAA